VRDPSDPTRPSPKYAVYINISVDETNQVGKLKNAITDAVSTK